MKLFPFIFTMLFSIGQQAQYVSSTYLLARFVFNDGNPATGSNYCSDQDHAVIDDAIVYRRRALRSGLANEFVGFGNTTTNEDMTTNTTLPSRELYPAFCKDVCAGYVARTCRASKCVGYRRELFVAATWCPSYVDMLHSFVDSLIMFNRVSDTCKNFLARSKRSTFCAIC